MKIQTRLLAGSAIGLLALATPHWTALASSSIDPSISGDAVAASAPVLLSQDSPPLTEEELLKKKQQEEGQAPAEAPAPEAAPAEPQPQPEAAPQAEPEPAPAPEPQAEPAPQPEPQAEPAPEPQAEPAPAPEPQAEPAPQPKPEAQPAPEAQPEAEPQTPPAEQPAPQAEQPAPQPEATPETAPTPEPAPAEPTPETAPQPEAAPAQQAPDAPAPEAPAAEQPAPGQPAPDATQPAPDATQPDATGQPPADGAAPADGTAPADSGAAAQPENAAPVLDSAKEAPPATEGGSGEATAPAAPAQPAAPPPADDKAAQEQAQPAEIQAVTAEQGTRVEAPPPAIVERRPEGVDVVKEIGDRIVIQINNQIFVESSDRPRMTRGAREVYYEDLPRGRTRETVIREDGTQVITIRNSYGDIMRRSRITPDGREYVLAYVDDRYYDRVEDWRDPGFDLPPMVLGVPVAEYILDAGRVDNDEEYYTFLERPPVERVERLYSLEEVKRSARLRDKVPRVELDTVTFEFGSAEIAESEVQRLEGVASAMEKLLKRNPGETFLIEGHTDAVGADVANLALSDRRAEAVAAALTEVFGIPPENLATQGYGERYLKIKTEERERLNRRVVMRRITPLVAPVASAQ